MIDLKAVHPINFYNNQVIQNDNIGGADLYPVLEEINCIRSNTGGNIDDTLKDFVINNICNLTNTFIIKILEDNISKDEIAYMVDFYDEFNLRWFLYYNIDKLMLRNYAPENICNIIYSNIVFTINQFIQFYTIYKLVYNEEGVDLFSFLYKDTYGNAEPKPEELKYQNKYVFCTTIMNNILETEL